MCKFAGKEEGYKIKAVAHMAMLRIVEELKIRYSSTVYEGITCDLLTLYPLSKEAMLGDHAFSYGCQCQRLKTPRKKLTLLLRFPKAVFSTVSYHTHPGGVV